MISLIESEQVINGVFQWKLAFDNFLVRCVFPVLSDHSNCFKQYMDESTDFGWKY